ncbi:YlbE-like family protein [Shouchella clausii]|jgi:hypothetical protein|uniref:YlbE-like protein n=3 Tax=Shouchella TaxID=2893057 RepID=Q5WFE2_SHOC1|nr:MULTISPECIES: YlbE-like family protein [Shouchella]MCM3312311.1 YlbE-like family protein [Psychrobacillus sp. MER TA 17]PAD44742.1 hypothetical protein CHH54_00315 [Bacillus sp. 7520-S]ALA54717.1 hypothetical protein DB29_03889 [Shouchella clausii]AST97394.1 hypothetical protein BC8716_16095 [Shouchella clausii]MBU3230703.1 YlbE-like family protein [Shouchella clausii]
MREEVQRKIFEQPELKAFIRYHPEWYRRLGRQPDQLAAMEREANYFYGKTWPQRVEKMQNNVSMVMMLMEMLKMGQNTVAETVQSVTNN